MKNASKVNDAHLHFDFTALFVVTERTVEHLIQRLNGPTLWWWLSLRFAATHGFSLNLFDDY
jgi:hypothetical protein